jgi:hypothetical protein
MTMSDDKIQDDYNLDAEGFFPCGPGDQRTCWIAGPRGPEDLVNTMDNCRSWGVGVSQGHYSRNSHLLRDADTVELILFRYRIGVLAWNLFFVHQSAHKILHFSMR